MKHQKMNKLSDKLLRRYKQGQITANTVILTLLGPTRKQHLIEILEILPDELLQRLKDFTADYKPEARIFRGRRPKAQSIRIVKEWLKHSAQPVSSKSA